MSDPKDKDAVQKKAFEDRMTSPIFFDNNGQPYTAETLPWTLDQNGQIVLKPQTPPTNE